MTDAPTTLPRPSVWARGRGQLWNLAPLVTLVALVVLFSAVSPSFATLSNLGNVLQQVSITAIIAVGLTYVILCAEIDLSVASVANATGIMVAFLTFQDASVNIANVPLPGPLAVVAALAGCLALGAVTAFGVTRIGIAILALVLIADIVFGAAAGILLDGLFAEYVLTAWSAGRSSLRTHAVARAA